MLLALLANLVLTIFVETVFALLASYRYVSKLILVIVAVNVLTNPLAQVAYNNWFGNLWLIEACVVVAEAVAFRIFIYKNIKDAFILSSLLNLASILVGILLQGVLFA